MELKIQEHTPAMVCWMPAITSMRRTPLCTYCFLFCYCISSAFEVWHHHLAKQIDTFSRHMWLDLLHNEMHDTSGSQRSHLRLGLDLGLVLVNLIVEQIKPYIFHRYVLVLTSICVVLHKAWKVWCVGVGVVDGSETKGTQCTVYIQFGGGRVGGGGQVVLKRKHWQNGILKQFYHYSGTVSR